MNEYDRKKIVFLNSSFGLGGAVKVIFTWANLLVINNFDVHLICNSNDPIIYDLDDRVHVCKMNLEKNGAQNIFLRSFSLWSHIKLMHNATIFVNKGNFIYPLLILKALNLLPRCKLVYYVHGGTGNFNVLYNNHRIFIINKLFDNIICLYDDFDSTPPVKSKRFPIILLNYIFSGKPDWSKVKIIPNPIDDKKYHSAASNPVKDSYEKPRVVVAAGRLVTLKRFDFLIRSFADAAKHVSGWTLHIYGEGPEYERLKDLISSLGVTEMVTLCGVTPDLPSVLAKCDLYVSSSRHEGFGMATLEAMSAGLPIVSTATKGSRFLLCDYPSDFIVPHDDQVVFANKLALVMSDTNLRSDLQVKSMKIARKFHVSRLLNDFKEVCCE